MEDCVHRLVVAYALRIVTTNYSAQCIVKSNVVFLYHLIVTNNIDGSIGGYKGYFINLLFAEEVISQ